ncbi:hypothetical protein B9Y72_08785 [Stenotrophomonas maltophilia]|nr:hypothetical protein B9Y68_08785 [Stenotrophomonas maltophilia]PJL21895.1 hypothetical protein B9Y72_08785 [Stenotrophomonas maltophilia]
MTHAKIVEQFELVADPTDTNSVLKALKKRLGELHPDRNGGSFTSDESRLNYHNIQSAIDSLESSGALVPLKEVTALVEALTKTMAPLAGAQEETLRAQRIIHIKESVRAKHRGIKVTSGTFLAISTALLAFMGSLKENPVLGKILEIQHVEMAILLAWIYSGALFALAWYREKKAESRAEFLSSEDGLDYILHELRFASLKTTINGQLTFTRRHIVDIMNSQRRYGSSLLQLLAPGIGRSAAETIASSQIDKLMSRGIVSRAPIKDVREWFQIEKHLIDNHDMRT